MRQSSLLAAVSIAALALTGGARAAVVVDSFTNGAFSLTGGPGGATVTASCGFTCLGGSRVVFVNPNSGPTDAFVQLSNPPGEAQSVIPGAGGQLRFTYNVPGANGIDLTSGGFGTDLWVYFTAFAQGADARVTIADTAGDTAMSVQSPAGPGLAIYPLANFTGVNLTQVQYVDLLIDSPGAGDYHVGDIRVPDPNNSTKAISIEPGSDTTTAGGDVGGYPSSPEIMILSKRGISPLLTTSLRLDDVSGDAGGTTVQVPASIMAGNSTDNGTIVTFSTMLGGFPPDPIDIMTHFEFMQPGDPSSIHTHKVMTDWQLGQKVFSATADVTTGRNDPGTYHHMLFVEVPPTQPGVITNVTALPGSMNLNVQMSGVDANQPVLWTVMGGSFTPTPSIPAVSPVGLIVLAVLLVVLGAALVVMRRRQPTEAGQ